MQFEGSATPEDLIRFVQTLEFYAVMSSLIIPFCP